ncbi:MAG: DUF748 domain-containing protein [Rubrivivax sp.]
MKTGRARGVSAAAARGRIALPWIAAGLLAALVALGVGAAWMLPGWLRDELQTRGSAWLGREVQVAAVEIDWSRLRLRLLGLSVSAQGVSGASTGAEPALRADRVEAGLSLRSLTARAPVLDLLEVQALRVRVARTGPQAFDFDDVLARLRPPAAPSSPPPPSAPPRLELRNVRVLDASLHAVDHLTGGQHALSGLTLELPVLSSLEGPASPPAQPRLRALVDGAPVQVQAELRPFAAAPDGQVSVEATGLALGRWWPYLPEGLPVQPRDGRLDLKLQASLAPGEPASPRLEIKGDASLADFSLADRQGRPLVSWGRLTVQAAEVSPTARRARLGLVRLESPVLETRREQAAAPRRPAAAPAPAEPAPAAEAPAWQVVVDRSEIADGLVRWLDTLVRPAAVLEAHGLQATASGLGWPLPEAAPVELGVALRSAGQALGRLQARGTVSQQAASVDLDLQALRLDGLAPWLRAFLVPAVSGRVQARGRLEWAAGPQPRLVAEVQRLRADGLRLVEPQQAEPVLSVAALELDGLRADLLARRVQLARVGLSRPQLRLARDEAGRIDATGWVAPGTATPAAPAAPAASAAPSSNWTVALADGSVSEASVIWRDLAASAAARPAGPRSALLTRALATGVRVDLPRLSVQGLAWPPGRSAARTALSVSIPRLADGTPPGTLQWAGTLGLEPLAARGTLRAERLPVHALEPYFGAQLPVELAHAELGVQAELDLKLDASGWQGRASGGLLVADVRAYSRVADSEVAVGDELLSWQSLQVDAVRLERAAGARPRLDIGQVVLSDLSTRLVITEQGRLNLVESAGAPGAASASAPPTPASSPGSSPGLPLDLSVGLTRLVRGQVNFSDRFVQPNYSAALTGLEGSLGAFATGSRQLPALELRGRAAGTADLEIRGTIDPTASPPVLDISARATGLELATLSPYAAKYAGYAIERGKLSADVAYRIAPDGQLQARNQVVVNQLTFGDKFDSPSATKLPVRLAVALLSDRNGVIDIDLPVSGSINDPQFSVFGLVMKVLGNLIVKAVTAPFAWLSGGGREDLSVVGFERGTNRLVPGADEVVERVARALADRPALRMTVTGAADPVSEREAMQAEALEQRLRVEQRRELARAGRALDAGAALPALTAADRERLLRRLWAESSGAGAGASAGTPAGTGAGASREPALDDIQARLLRSVVVSTDSARELAIQRGLAVREALVARGLAADRLFLAAPRLRVTGEDDAAWTPRVQLSLSVP